MQQIKLISAGFQCSVQEIYGLYAVFTAHPHYIYMDTGFRLTRRKHV